jgi:hypothetical protein
MYAAKPMPALQALNFHSAGEYKWMKKPSEKSPIAYGKNKADRTGRTSTIG